MATKRVFVPPRKGYQPIDILYRDTVVRGPSRLSAQSLKTDTASTSTQGIETIPTNGLRSLLFNRRQPRLFAKGTRDAKRPNDMIPVMGKFADDSLYTRRHKFLGYTKLLQLIDQGSIVEAMTRFYMGSRSWALVYHGKITLEETDYEISPHIIHDLVERLSRLATMTDAEWQGVTQEITRESYWIPPQMGTNTDIREINVPTLAFHALVDIYDMGGAVGINLDATAIAAMIHAASYHLDVEPFTKCVHLTLLRLSGISLHQAQLELAQKTKVTFKAETYKALPNIVVKEIIEGYGRMGVPHLGEVFARDWSSSIAKWKDQGVEKQVSMERAWYLANDRKEQSFDVPVWLNSSGWASDMRIWSALIRSRADALDLAGARHWLNRYRQEGLESTQEVCGDNCGRPHIAYITALSSVRKQKKANNEVSKRNSSYVESGKTRYEAIIDAVRLMHQDGAAMTEKLLLLCINVHIGFDKLAEAASMIKLLFKSKDSLAATRPSFYRIFFHLHRAVHSRRSIDIQQLTKLVKEGNNENADALANLRGLFQEFHSRLIHKNTIWSRRNKLEVLTEALRASLAARDLPLAYVVLSSFKELRIPATDQIISIVAGNLMEKSDRSRPTKDKKAAKHAWDVATNMKAWMKANDTKETPYQETTWNSPPYVKNPEIQFKNLDSLINIVKAEIWKKVTEGIQFLDQSDPEWLQAVCQILKGASINSREKILQVALSPVQDGLGKNKLVGQRSRSDAN